MDQARTGLHASKEIGTGQSGGIAERLMLAALSQIRNGELELATLGGILCFGDPACGIRARATVLDARAYNAGLWGGEVGLGEAYMKGWWTSDDLVTVVRLAVRNMSAFDRKGLLTNLGRALQRWRHLGRTNHLAGSKANIAHHYDLGNEFYRLFLDESMAYSCAYFLTESDSLHQAQVNKFDLICRKLRLGKEDHLLEIGTGWGGFAFHAATRYGCRVTTTTISQQQYDHAERLIEEHGLQGQVELRFQDYRHLEGQYDKAVSIEMFEAVGLKYYDTFFGTVDRLLKPGGVMLLQTITMNEQGFPRYHKGTDWIQQYIFPGAELASVSEVIKSLARSTSMGLVHLEDIGPHYARTLRAWREAFCSKLDAVRALGFDETFIRMWDYYLAYCEGAFLERYIGDAQMLLSKDGSLDPQRLEPWSVG
jgi:cyclopropane-fatty-acyl-phospholipid synthase